MSNTIQTTEEEASLIIRKGKCADDSRKINRGLIIYRSKKYERKSLKYGLASNDFCYRSNAPLEQKKKQYKMLKQVWKSTVKYFVVYIELPKESKLSYLLLFFSRIRSLNNLKVTIVDKDPKLRSEPFRQFLKKLLNQNKRIEMMNVFSSSHFILIPNIKTFSLLKNLRSLEIEFADYYAKELLFLLTIFSSELKKAYKRRLFKKLKNQHFSIHLEFENLEDPNSLADCLSELDVITEQVKTDFSFLMDLGSLSEEDFTNFQKALKTIRHVRDFWVKKESNQDLTPLLDAVNKNHLRSLAIVFPKNVQQNESFFIRFPDFIKEMNSLNCLTVSLANLHHSELLNLFAINLGKFTQMTNLYIEFTEKNTEKLTDDILMNFAGSFKLLENLQELGLEMKFQKTQEKSFNFSFFKNFFESFGYLTKLKKLDLNYQNQTAQFHHIIQSLCSSLKLLKNLEILCLNFSGVKTGDLAIAQLAKVFPYLEKIKTVEIWFNKNKELTNKGVLNLFSFLSSVDSLLSLIIRIHIPAFTLEVVDKLIKYVNSMKNLQFLKLKLDVCYRPSDSLMRWMKTNIQEMEKRMDTVVTITTEK